MGILLYQLICGKVPFSGPDEFDVLNQHVTKKPPRPSEKRKGITTRQIGEEPEEKDD